MTTSDNTPRGLEPAAGLIARFEPLAPGQVPGFAMKITVRGVQLALRGLPLLARLGGQELRGVAVSPAGDGFMGLLEHAPHEGDRLSFGYESALHSTDVVYRALVA
ncbi:MAG TPA: hypothetical protein VMG41_09970 [Gemmatimonadales bacterium]|nr:hypothetical protein [Anaeromyxobacteraceae bacterium]HTS88805.1 hypothetical protein [Gemmatimonadales bacterium]